MQEKSVVGGVPQRAVFSTGKADGRRVIGVVAPSYGLERVAYMMPSDRHRYVKLSAVPLHRLERRGTYWNQSPLIVGPRVALVHTFNQIPINRRFAVSVEMELPRFLGSPSASQMRAGFDRLMSDRCRGIWPLSEAARAYIQRRFERHGAGALAAKTEVFRGAVQPLAAGAERAGYSERGPIKLLFVGTDGLRKGLGPTLEAVERLRAGGVEVEITVIGRATEKVYLVPGQTFATDRVDALLGRPWVTRHRAMPNREVRALMGTHDLFVFPTMDESLGWVAAEAGLSGLPTISTDVFALPELVRDGETGWTIPVPLNEDRRWIHIGDTGGRDAWDAIQATIADRLVATIAAIAADRGIIARFGGNAKSYITRLYGIDVATAHLERLYAAA